MANVNFSLAHFNAIAAGHYNAGDVVIRTDQQGNAVLDKVNNHVTKTHLNNVTLSAEEVISVKESFLDALARGGVKDGKLAEIRAKLGLPAEMSASDDLAAQANVMERRFKPLTRAEVREILDDYANGGRGFGKAQEEIGISSLRMGNVVGVHEVHICTENQTLTLRHEAGDRGMLADGAVDAARFICGKAPGLYNMDHLLEERK